MPPPPPPNQILPGPAVPPRCALVGGPAGPVDVSHGRVDIAPDAAPWLYTISRLGDPVTVRDTGSPLTCGDSWTDRNRAGDEYVKGGMIPYTPAAASPAPSQS